MIKILIVDDEKPICDLIDLNLSASGYQCRTVQDGLEALKLIEEENFDLILLDIMLPGADGYDIMEYIRPMGIPGEGAEAGGGGLSGEALRRGGACSQGGSGAAPL